jgi:hypothetical protein
MLEFRKGQINLLGDPPEQRRLMRPQTGPAITANQPEVAEAAGLLFFRSVPRSCG